ncbi:hypothetical protein QQ045_033052 [Rhodiola kirilowii]
MNRATGAIVLATNIEFSPPQIQPTDEGPYVDDKLIDDGCVPDEHRADGDLLVFSEEEIEGDKEDLFCVPDEDMEQIRINFSQSLKSVFSTEKESQCLDGKIDDADYIPSDDLLSDSESSGEEDGVRHYMWFNEKTGVGPMIELTLGLQFRNAIVFRSALREFAIRNGFNFDHINHKSNQIRAQCRNEDCPWRISASNQVDKNGDAYKRGFLAGCRPLLSLDACHLKGAYNGQIHAAVGRDGNDNMFPIAYAICESESKHTWRWFLQNLLMDIGNSRSDEWCFISDQQKGLHEALKELYPSSEHRFCEARDQPILTCLETIRKLLMKRIYEKRTGIEKYLIDICPHIFTNMEDNNGVSMHCDITYGGGNLMEVEYTVHGTYVVNVHERSCTCRLWDLTGIPCSHGCAAIRCMRGDPADYVHQSYRKSKFKKVYEFYIQPLPRPSEWPQQEGQLVLPPLFRRQVGRQRRRRIREANEPINVHKKR